MPDSPQPDSRPDEFELSLDDMLERVSASTRDEQDSRGNADSASAKRAPRPPISPPAAIGGMPSAAPRRRRIVHYVAWPLVALLSVSVGVISKGRWHRVNERDQLTYESLPSPAAGRPLALPSSLPVAAERGLLKNVTVDTDASTESLMLDEFDQAGGGLHLSRPTADPGAAPAFAIARYDTLQAVATDWRLVAPLNVEAVYALVLVTSPLRELGDLRGRSINIGAPGSARATSGAALYRALFGEPLPSSPLRSAPKDAGLQALVAGNLDAMILFDGQPSAWLEALPVGTRRRLKVLRFDATGLAGRKALQVYLPASVVPALANSGTAVPTLGELSFLIVSPLATRPQQVLESLCERLPALQAHGHPDWKHVDPSLQLPLKLQRISDLDATLRACRTSRTISSPILSLSGTRP